MLGILHETKVILNSSSTCTKHKNCYTNIQHSINLNCSNTILKLTRRSEEEECTGVNPLHMTWSAYCRRLEQWWWHALENHSLPANLALLFLASTASVEPKHKTKLGIE